MGCKLRMFRPIPAPFQPPSNLCSYPPPYNPPRGGEGWHPLGKGPPSPRPRVKGATSDRQDFGDVTTREGRRFEAPDV